MLKKVLDSPVDEVIISVVGSIIPNLPVNQINKIKGKIEVALPKVLLELNLINTAVNNEDVNVQLQEILKVLQLLPDEVKAEKYHIIASKLLVILSDGKIS